MCIMYVPHRIFLIEIVCWSSVGMLASFLTLEELLVFGKTQDLVWNSWHMCVAQAIQLTLHYYLDL